MSWQVVIIVALLIFAAVGCILIAFAAQAKAHSDASNNTAFILDGQRLERQDHAAQIQAVLDAMAEDRDVLMRAVVAKHAPEVAMMSHADQATAVADSHVRFAQSLDPARDAMLDPETGEDIRLAGVGSG